MYDITKVNIVQGVNLEFLHPQRHKIYVIFKYQQFKGDKILDTFIITINYYVILVKYLIHSTATSSEFFIQNVFFFFF